MQHNDPPQEGREEDILDRVMSRIDVPSSVKDVVDDALRGVAEELERSVRSSVEVELVDGLCTFGFHRSYAEFQPNGNCRQWCRSTRCRRTARP